MPPDKGLQLTAYRQANEPLWHHGSTSRAFQPAVKPAAAEALVRWAAWSVIRDAEYVHTNLVARDYRALARFYQDLFGCTIVPPERDYSGPDLEAGTAVPGASLKGVHLRLPGPIGQGPTLEIFEYSDLTESEEPAVNRPGFGHIAFSVASVKDAREEVLAKGGSSVGRIVSLRTTTGATVRWCYVRDPEGNIIELQSWA